MFTEESRAHLAKPLIARMSTIDKDGYPHTVPLWFDLDGDDVVIISERSTVKVYNAQANPKGAVTIGGDPGESGDLEPGYLIKGIFSVEEDPGHEWMKRITRRYETPEVAEKNIAEWSNLDMIVIRLKVEKVIRVA